MTKYKKMKIYADVPRRGEICKGGWIYYGYVSFEHSSKEYMKHILDLELHDIHKAGNESKVKEGTFPNRWDIWYRKKMPKRTERFLK
jgi:hypothetical protein